jgi:hypothetical protein
MNPDKPDSDKRNMFSLLEESLFNKADNKKDFGNENPLPKHLYIAFLK